MTAEQKTALDGAVWVDPGRMSDAPCFRNTRVPIQSLIDFLGDGETVEGFLALYPSITREQVITVLDFANRQLIERVSSLTSV
jgi:uncharacterized protein (DUF433 family)